METRFTSAPLTPLKTCGRALSLVTEHLELVSAMLQPRVASLPERVRAVFLQNAIKVFSTALTQMSRAAVRPPLKL